jgi:hypothetical protein
MSDDIDCLAGITKAQIKAALKGKRKKTRKLAKLKQRRSGKNAAK